MNALFAKYRKVLEQCFVPIFVRDEFDTETLLRGCRMDPIAAEAGAKRYFEEMRETQWN